MPKNDIKTDQKISFACVFWGLIFFFNPIFAAIDVLPDFIGCLLLWLGLQKISKIYLPLTEAKSRFLKLSAVYLVKDLILFAIYAMGNDAEQPTALLATAFGIMALELLLLLPSITSLFDGITSLAMRADCKALYNTRERNRLKIPFIGRKRPPKYLSSRGEALARTSIIFLLVRNLFGIIPEFSSLTISSYTDKGTVNLYEHIGIMRLITAIPVLLFGLFWISTLATYFLRIHREAAFSEYLSEKYREYREAHPGDSVIAQHGVAFLLLSIGAFFTADFYLDFKNIFPDVVAAIFFLFGVALLRVSKEKKLLSAGLAVAYGAISVLSSSFAYRFATEYRASDIARNDVVAAAYRWLWLTSLLEFLVFVGFIVSLMLALRETVKSYAGYRAIHTDLSFEERRREEYESEFDDSFIKIGAISFAAGLFSFLFDYIKDIPGKGFFSILEFFWFFDMAMSIAFAICLTTLLFGLLGEIRKKYQYDGIAAPAARDTISVPLNKEGDSKAMQNRNQNNQNNNQNQNNQNQNNQNQNNQNNNQNQNNQNQNSRNQNGR